jgi:hypothetical protein
MALILMRRRWLLIALAITAGLIGWAFYLFRPYATHPAADTSWKTSGTKMNVTVSLVDTNGQPISGPARVTVWTDGSQPTISELTNVSGSIDHMAGGEMLALDVNGVRIVQRIRTGPLGELFGPNTGWGLSVTVVVKDPAALGFPP